MTAEQIVKSIEPEGGWWKSATGEEFESASRVMLTAGIPSPLVIEVLDSLRVAMAGEYGN